MRFREILLNNTKIFYMDYGLHKSISPLINLMHLLANNAAL